MIGYPAILIVEWSLIHPRTDETFFSTYYRISKTKQKNLVVFTRRFVIGEKCFSLVLSIISVDVSVNLGTYMRNHVWEMGVFSASFREYEWSIVFVLAVCIDFYGFLTQFFVRLITLSRKLSYLFG